MEWHLEKVLMMISNGRLTNCKLISSSYIIFRFVTHSRILIMQENGLINHWRGQQQFNMTIKNSLMANNHLSNVMDCMADVFQTKGTSINRNTIQ